MNSAKTEPSVAAMSDPFSKHNGHAVRVGRATHHIYVNRERLVLAGAPLAGAPPDLDEVGAGAQCGDCERDVFEALEWDPARELFVCECGATYGLREGGYLTERPRGDEGGR